MRNNSVDYGLKFFNKVLGLNELHWGYFTEKQIQEDNLTLSMLRKAQKEYTLHLLSYIPDGVQTILDVGCGLGEMAKLLLDRGYKVSLLSSDRYQEKVIKEKYPFLKFICSRFEDFVTSERYDMLLMAESVQYLLLEESIRNVNKLLNQNGYLLIADYFRKNNTKYYRTCKVLSEFKKALENNSFYLCEAEDITDYVVPTIDFAMCCYNKYVLPSIEVLKNYTDTKISKLAMVVIRSIFRRQVNRLRYYIEVHTPHKLDSSVFKEKMNYVIQLWQKRL
jgi:MPBQ/MSBQ methyltransferase